MERPAAANLDLATAATYRLRHEAEIARARLAAEGIDALVVADDEGGLNPGFFAEYGVRVVVRREDLAHAAALLAPTGPESVPDQIVIHAEHREAIVAHARFCEPEEACGLLAFESPGRVRFVYPLTNAEHSPHRFTIDAAEHFGALRHAERCGWEITGAFHSHPSGPARPSATDVAAASAGSWIHLIVGSLRVGSPDVRAFVIDGQNVREVRILPG